MSLILYEFRKKKKINYARYCIVNTIVRIQKIILLSSNLYFLFFCTDNLFNY